MAHTTKDADEMMLQINIDRLNKAFDKISHIENKATRAMRNAIRSTDDERELESLRKLLS